MSRLVRDPVDRFVEKVEITDDCWLWTAADDGKGYGKFRTGATGSRIVGAHRFAYEASVGPIPEGLVLDHLCLNTRCVNPDHLEPVTAAENTRRFGATFTHCPHGHPIDGLRGDGRRYCRECNRISCARRYQPRGLLV